MAPRYRVTLEPEERQELLALTRTRKSSGKLFVYARALLLCDHGPGGSAWTVAGTAEALGVSQRTIEHLKQRFVEDGLEAALRRQPRQRKARTPKFDGAFEARLVALACTPAPAARRRWTMRPARGKGRRAGSGSVRLGHDDPACAKKNELQPHLKQYWRIPPDHNAAFVACMKDVLAVYSRPYDAARPVLCMDETSKQLIGEVRSKIPVAPGQTERWEHEYVRNGVAQVFLEVEPLAGRRHVEATQRRTRKDWARWIRGMLEDRYPQAERVVLVLDNLNTHAIASLYEAYPPDQARTLAERLEIHFTPKHGSWLNIAEIELSVLCGQCLNRRIPDLPTTHEEIAAWLQDRNTRQSKVDWQFTTADARTKLKHLYPKL